MRSTLSALIASACLIASAPHANAVTNAGRIFDNIPSLIYDSSNGDVYLENLSLPPLLIQRISIIDVSGQLKPGLLNLPTMASPLINFTPRSPHVIDVGWPNGPFLTTGHYLGRILQANIPQAMLLNDLTIDFGLMSTQLAGIGDLIYDTSGTTQGNPFLPSSGSSGAFQFVNIPSGKFVDPPTAVGYTYTMTSASLFTEVGLPMGLGNSFTITSSEGTVPNLTGGSLHTFAAGVSTFQITGINPPVDGTQPNAFPVYVAFSTATASFDMQAINAPEPATALIAGAVTLLTGAHLRRRRTG